jgi:hypothetical protein
MPYFFIEIIFKYDVSSKRALQVTDHSLGSTMTEWDFGLVEREQRQLTLVLVSPKQLQNYKRLMGELVWSIK